MTLLYVTFLKKFLSRELSRDHLGFVYCVEMEGSCWCQMDGANCMPSHRLNFGYYVDHLDPKRLGFVIYLVLRMHQFQKYHLLSSLIAGLFLHNSNLLFILQTLCSFSFDSPGCNHIKFGLYQELTFLHDKCPLLKRH